MGVEIDCKDSICAPADGTKTAAEMDGGSARPLAARLTNYLSLTSIR